MLTNSAWAITNNQTEIKPATSTQRKRHHTCDTLAVDCIRPKPPQPRVGGRGRSLLYAYQCMYMQRLHICNGASMHLCSHARTCVSTSLRLYTYMSPYVHLHVYVCMYSYVFKKKWTIAHMCVRMCVCMYVCMYLCIYVSMYGWLDACIHAC